MLHKLLCQEDQNLLVKLAKLIAIADKPLLWDGKNKDEITSATDLNKVSILKGDAESKVVEALDSKGAFLFSWGARDELEELFIEKIKAYPLKETESPETRVAVTTTMLKQLFTEGQKSELPFVPKLILFELMLLALCTGSISSIGWTLLKQVQHHYQLKDFIFDDLLDRAEMMNREVSKTISIILE